MKHKWIATWLFVLCCLIGGYANAYDINMGDVVKQNLSYRYTYVPIEGTHTMTSEAGSVTYQMGQIRVIKNKMKDFFFGYLAWGPMPDAYAAAIKPYFYGSTTEEEWKNLITFNRALLHPGSAVRKGIDNQLRQLAVQAAGPVTEKDFSVELSQIEPFRRLSSDNPEIYTMGGHIDFHSGVMKYPMYGRVYFFPNDGNIEMMLFLVPDEGKDFLLYAVDDLVKIMAHNAAVSISGNDLAVTLGKYRLQQEANHES
jgi:hypothetical protein